MAGAKGSATGRRNPERTRQRILDAATGEFSDKGLKGARVDQIATRAGINKRMLYHYFGNKEDLFLAVLEAVYAEVRGDEERLNLNSVDPVEGIRRLVLSNFETCRNKPYWISLLNSENLHGARHLKRSARILALQSPLIASIADLLHRGSTAGQFRDGIDPVQLYISITALNYFYFSNNNTLSTIFDRDLMASQALAERCQINVDMVVRALRP